MQCSNGSLATNDKAWLIDRFDVPLFDNRQRFENRFRRASLLPKVEGDELLHLQ